MVDASNAGHVSSIPDQKIKILQGMTKKKKSHWVPGIQGEWGVGGRGRNKWGFEGNEIVLYGAVLADAGHCGFVKTHGMSNTKSEPECELWTSVDNSVISISSSVAIKLPH